MLHDAQRTDAPRSTSVSIKTAVWIVMCREPVMRTPASGFWGAYSSRIAISPGISFSAIEISFRPKSARPMSLTLKSCFVFVFVLIINLFGRLFQFCGLVGLFPRDLGVVDVTEVTVVRGLLVNRAKQIELLDDIGRLETKCSEHRALDRFFIDAAGGKCIDVNAERFRVTDCVSKLDLALRCESGCNHILRDPTSHVSCAPIDFARILSGKCATTMSSHSAVAIDNNFSTGQASVALRAADNEVAGRIDEKLCFGGQHFFRQNFFDHLFDDEAANLRVLHIARVLR